MSMSTSEWEETLAPDEMRERLERVRIKQSHVTIRALVAAICVVVVAMIIAMAMRGR